MSAYVQDKAHVIALIHYLRQIPAHQRPSNRLIIYPKTQFFAGQYGWPAEKLDGRCFAMEFGCWDEDDTWLAVARCLYDQNVRSVNYRYQDSEPDTDTFEMEDLPKATVWMMPRMPHREAWVACGGYDYQACETPDYALTPAAAIIGVIRKLAGNALAGDANTWSISDFPTTAQLLASI